MKTDRLRSPASDDHGQTHTLASPYFGEALTGIEMTRQALRQASR